MPEVNLLKNYPKSKRKIVQRAAIKSSKIRRIARQFGKAFFDGDRKYGYGGYTYHPRFWEKVVADFQKFYGLNNKSKILDVGCAKGFMLFDFMRLISGIKIAGIDISEYAISQALPQIKPYLQVGNVISLPFPDKSFDLVIAINTVHNLPRAKCMQAVNEIQRVTKKHAFITVDAYRTQIEKERMMMWALTARTILSVAGWKVLFKKANYTGDYYWFIP